MRDVLTMRVLKFLNEKSEKYTEDYDKFYKDYSIFLKEGIVSTDIQKEKVMYISFLLIHVDIIFIASVIVSIVYLFV